METETSRPRELTAAEQVESALVERIDKGKIELPLLPQVAGQVMALANDPSVDAARLSALIHQDQSLAAHVLRIANSPAYMPRTPIVSLQHAVAMLGVNLLSEIALTVSLKHSALQVSGYEADVKQLWRHALASGVYAKEIARLRRFNVESAYLCGLLHAIGKPVVLKAVVAIVVEGRIPIDRDAVISFMEGYHARVGTIIAKEWSLPKQVGEAITFYTMYEQTPTYKQEAMMTCLSDRLASYLVVPDSFDETTVREHSVFADLNLYPNDVDSLLRIKDKVLNLVDALAI
ncbi:MAG TPA: HDOD domain-containing protein [Nitrospira sp.]|nr:HDOD domain-containing protein [Nitrospira sp.]